ncbi:hypothetical protein MRX96_009109 [Rhipicephalus microplus]
MGSSTDTSDSSDSDSDAKACAYEREFNKLFRIPAKRPKVVGFIEDVVRQYSDHEFRRHFRLARPVAEKLVAEFAVSSMCPSSTHGGVQAKSAETHVLTFIWYAANKTLHARRGKPFRHVRKHRVQSYSESSAVPDDARTIGDQVSRRLGEPH